MEKISAFVLGLLVLSLSVIPIFFGIIVLPRPRPSIVLNQVGLYLPFLYFALILSIAAGILLLIGGIKVHRAVEGTGFGIGCVGWTIFIIYAILGIVVNKRLIVAEIQSSIFYSTFYNFPILPYTALYEEKIVNYIIGLCCIIGSSVLGTIAFIIVQKH